MSTLLEVRAGIKDAVKDIVETSDVERASIAPPAAVVLSPNVTYYSGSSSGSNGLVEVEFSLMVNVGAQLIDESSRLLTELANTSGDRSIPAAITAAHTLGGTVDDAVVSAFRPFGIEEYAAVGYWGGIFTILTLWRRDQ